MTFLNFVLFNITPEKSLQIILVFLKEHPLKRDPLRFTLKKVLFKNDTFEEIDLANKILE